MKIHQIVCSCFLLLYTELSAQKTGVAIGIDRPDESAILHVQPPNDDKGLLIPRLSSDPSPSKNTIKNIDNPQDGLVVYDVYKKGFMYWDESLPNVPATSPDKWVEVMPQGMISMWSGTNPPKGWVICDGTQGTPNLSGRFIVGYASGNADYGNPGNKSLGGNNDGNRGGLASVTLTANQSGLRGHNHPMNHGHSVTDPGHTHQIDNHGNEDVGDANKQASYNRNAGAFITSESSKTGITVDQHTGNTGDVLASNALQAHENRPPYYVLAFIMKL